MKQTNQPGKRIAMSALGVSAYDAVALIWSEQQTRLPFSICRVITDVVCVLCGAGLCALAGFTLRQITGEVGIGTVITAFFMGPLIDLFSARVAQPFLNWDTKAAGGEKI